MKIGIIGSGHMGGNLGKLWARAGHHVLFSSRHPEQLESLVEQIGSQARTGSVLEAANYGDLVLLATPFSSLPNALDKARSLTGRIVIDITNPVAWDDKRNKMVRLIPDKDTAVSTVLSHEPNARVIKAFSHLHWQHLITDTNRPEKDRIGIYYCGDDSLAKRVVEELIKESGFSSVDIGGLENAWLMEIPGPLSQKALGYKQALRLLSQVKRDQNIAA